MITKETALLPVRSSAVVFISIVCRSRLVKGGVIEVDILLVHLILYVAQAFTKALVVHYFTFREVYKLKLEGRKVYS